MTEYPRLSRPRAPPSHVAARRTPRTARTPRRPIAPAPGWAGVGQRGPAGARPRQTGARAARARRWPEIEGVSAVARTSHRERHTWKWEVRVTMCSADGAPTPRRPAAEPPAPRRQVACAWVSTASGRPAGTHAGCT
jgi:hypothetical protein